MSLGFAPSNTHPSRGYVAPAGVRIGKDGSVRMVRSGGFLWCDHMSKSPSSSLVIGYAGAGVFAFLGLVAVGGIPAPVGCLLVHVDPVGWGTAWLP